MANQESCRGTEAAAQNIARREMGRWFRVLSCLCMACQVSGVRCRERTTRLGTSLGSCYNRTGASAKRLIQIRAVLLMAVQKLWRVHRRPVEIDQHLPSLCLGLARVSVNHRQFVLRGKSRGWPGRRRSRFPATDSVKRPRSSKPHGNVFPMPALVSPWRSLRFQAAFDLVTNVSRVQQMEFLGRRRCVVPFRFETVIPRRLEPERRRRSSMRFGLGSSSSTSRSFQ